MNSLRYFLLLVAGGWIASSGCGKKSDGLTLGPLPLTPDVQLLFDDADKSPEAALTLLNDTLKDWLLRHPDYPRTVHEFVTARVLPKLPKPPPGKEFSIDRTRGVVVLVDK